MKNKMRNKEGGFLQLIVILIVVLLIMNYFGLTVTGVLAYFHTSISEIIAWFKNLFFSVAR